MQKFELKRRSDIEIVAKSLTDLEQLYQAISDGETFILSAAGHGEVIVGSALNKKIVDGIITLKSEL